MELVEALRARFPDADVRFIDTVCQPTKDRQRALRQLAADTDVVVVVGGPDSNNSRKLAELARSLGRPAYLVADAAELRPEWFEDCELVGPHRRHLDARPDHPGRADVAGAVAGAAAGGRGISGFSGGNSLTKGPPCSNRAMTSETGSP